jgi:hypothetical protein
MLNFCEYLLFSKYQLRTVLDVKIFPFYRFNSSV